MNLTSKIRLSLKRAFLGLLLVPLVMTPKLAMANVPVIDTINNAIQSAMAAAEALYFAADEAQQILIQQTIQDIPAAATQTELAAMSWESQLTNHKTNTDYRRDQANIAASAAITEDNETIRLLCTIDRATTTRLYTEALGHEEVVRLYKGWEYWDRLVSNGTKAIADINNSRCTVKGSGEEDGIGFMNPIDGPPAGCVATNKKFYDADISYETLVASIHKPSLETPKANATGGFDVDLTKDQQILYIAARNYCYNQGGPNKAPSKNKQHETADGRAWNANYATLKSRKSEAVLHCLKKLADISRHNCTSPEDDDVKALCESDKLMCQFAKQYNVPLVKDNDIFAGCVAGTEGLSRYHREQISKATQHQLITMAGAKEALYSTDNLKTELMMEGNDLTEKMIEVLNEIKYLSATSNLYKADEDFVKRSPK